MQIDLVLEIALSSDTSVQQQGNSEQRYFRLGAFLSCANLRATVELCDGISAFALDSLRDIILSLPF